MSDLRELCHTTYVTVSPTPKKRVRHPKPKFHTEIQILDSDWIQSVQYDPAWGILDATLRSGQRYRYRHVTAQMFALVVTAKSSGAAFNKWIKPLGHTHLPAVKPSAKVIGLAEFVPNTESRYDRI